MIRSKKQMFIVVGVFTLMLMLVTTTYAFFNYTRTGSANTIKVGRISFKSTQGTAINLTNMFPIDASEGIPDDATKVGTVSINVTGDTTYGGGIEYLVSAVNVNNIINGKNLPVSVAVDYSPNGDGKEIGTEDSDYFDNRGGNSSIYKVLMGSTIRADKLLVGYIAPGAKGIDGNITIKAYLDKNLIAISDTYPPGYNYKYTYDEYEYNQNSSEEVISNCTQHIENFYVSHGWDIYLEDGETYEAFCRGTGSLDGYGIVESAGYHVLYDETIEYLKTLGIINQTSYSGYTSWNDETTDEWVNNRKVFTTDEWNSLQENGVSFQIKVEANEGIWVDNPNKLYNIMSRNSVMDNINSTYVNNSTPGISFSSNSSDSNGKGIYTRAGTENMRYPIMYYRGDVDNNNVSFADKCWKIVRTTDTGGIKMIYNGEKNYEYTNEFVNINTYMNDQSENDVDFDDQNKTILYTKNNATAKKFGIKLPTGDNYSIIVTAPTYYSVTIYKNNGYYYGGSNSNGTTNISTPAGSFTSDDLIEISIYNSSSYQYPIELNIKVQQNGVDLDKSSYIIRKYVRTENYNCNNNGDSSQITVGYDNSFKFNPDENTPAYVGYMYGTPYEWTNEETVTNAYYGAGFTYENNKYKLTDPQVGTDSNHRYTCNSTNPDATCDTIRYYLAVYRYNYDYVSLTGGKKIEDTIDEMFANENDSIVKSKVDEWYQANMTSYTSKIEDTLYCNDRSTDNYGPWYITTPSTSPGTTYAPSVVFGYANRTYYNGGYTTGNQPVLNCSNLDDSFGVNVGNQKLTYPVALITADEVRLAGTGSNSYINSGNNYHTMSPAGVYSFYSTNVCTEVVTSSGSISVLSTNSSGGLRPVISLQHDSVVDSGTGTITDPYVIK